MLGATAAGASIRQIAAELGVSVGTVHEDLNAELLTVRDRTGSLTENYRDLEMMRMDATTTPPGRIDVLKIDCEGAEFPILLTSRLLDRIDRIVGEYHELRAQLSSHVRIPGYDEFSVEGLAAGLERAGFTVTWERQATAQFGDLGLFFAERRYLEGPGRPPGLRHYSGRVRRARRDARVC